MSIDDKARKLLMQAWTYFDSYADGPAFYRAYIAEDEQEDVFERVERIIRGTS